MDNSVNNSKTQVIIVGAGPTGLSMAIQLCRYNIDFILLDKKDRITTFSKALVVQARTLEIFDEIALAQKAIDNGRITTAMNFFYKGRRRAAINISGMGEGLSPFPFALSLEQSKTEKLLAEYLYDHGKKIEWNAELTRIERDENSVSIYYKGDKGVEQKLKADYIVGCDGAGSIIRHQMGLSFEGTTKPKLFYVADVILKSSVINKNELFMYMIRKGFILFFPMEGEGHYRIVGIMPDAQDDGEQIRFDEIEPKIKTQIISPVEFEELKWFSSYRVHSRKANAFMNERFFIAGDAAHIHTPAGGQGMNTGIQDAYNLAWKIAGLLKGEINAECLRTYNTERTKNAKHLLNTTDRMFDIMSGINRFWNFIRLNFFPSLLNLITKSKIVQKRLFPLISQTGIAYPESYLTVKSSVGKVKAGDRMHYFVFSNGKQIFSYLTEPAFKLLFFGNEHKFQGSKIANSKIKLKKICFIEIPSSIFGNATDFYILLRPDNHVSYIGKEINECQSLLNKISKT